MEGEEAYLVSNAVVPEERRLDFDQGPDTPPTSDRIVVRDAITGIPFHVEEAMIKLVPEPLTGQHKGVHNRLSAALESRFQRTV